MSADAAPLNPKSGTDHVFLQSVFSKGQPEENVVCP
jgi:hypothetical protein